MSFLAKLLANPWALAAIFAFGVAIGTSGAWTVQGYRLDAAKLATKLVQQEFDQFKDKVKTEGEIAQKASDATKARQEKEKQDADQDWSKRVAVLTSDNNELREQASHTPSSFLSTPEANSLRPDLTCYDRAEFDTTLQRYVQQSRIGAENLLAEGDQTTLSLNVGKEWAQKP